MKQGLLLRKGSPEAKDDERIAHAWGFWLPEASLHFWTKNAPYVRDESAAARRIKDALLVAPQPKIFKSVKGGDSFRLPSQNFPNSEFVRVLLARKTHRHFRKQSLSLESVSRLLSLVWGVTGYIHSPRFGKLLRKTSPSGGGRHPGEVYLMALRVKGLRRGLYYYHPSHHRLDRISTPATPTRAWQYCARQQFVKNAAALFLMTAVFPRTIWKYRHPRAYRVVLLETGHLCQTFCLVATWLGLAPFCTAALNDLLIEKDLGIDGIHESVLYVAGVGYPNTAEHPAHSVNRALGHEHHHRRNLAFRIGERVTR
ncbi:MAG TPA: SagB family peptide dehydrogenase [Chthoniobacterales bacterium]|nr:SagB family peptide dehydrogenase [Chthoniobacterales bacterium]